MPGPRVALAGRAPRRGRTTAATSLGHGRCDAGGAAGDRRAFGRCATTRGSSCRCPRRRPRCSRSSPVALERGGLYVFDYGEVARSGTCAGPAPAHVSRGESGRRSARRHQERRTSRWTSTSARSVAAGEAGPADGAGRATAGLAAPARRAGQRRGAPARQRRAALARIAHARRGAGASFRVLIQERA